MTTKATETTAKDEAKSEVKKAPRTEVKLAKPHRHEGQDLAVGSTIKVTARQRKWLQELEVIEQESK
ncbi:DUF7210 family protein [Pseudomonas sp. Marseille-QA0892]